MVNWGTERSGNCARDPAPKWESWILIQAAWSSNPSTLPFIPLPFWMILPIGAEPNQLKKYFSKSILDCPKKFSSLGHDLGVYFVFILGHPKSSPNLSTDSPDFKHRHKGQALVSTPLIQVIRLLHASDKAAERLQARGFPGAIE